MSKASKAYLTSLYAGHGQALNLMFYSTEKNSNNAIEHAGKLIVDLAEKLECMPNVPILLITQITDETVARIYDTLKNAGFDKEGTEALSRIINRRQGHVIFPSDKETLDITEIH
jgi:hypothetical protein